MDFPTICKTDQQKADHNFSDYCATTQRFFWDAAWQRIAGDKESVNIAYEAVDRHVAAGYGQQPAMRFLRKSGDEYVITYADLKAQTARFANLLHSLECAKGARVYGLAGRVPQLYIALLGTLKYGAVFTPLFSAFGPEPIQSRMEIGEANVLVTSARLYRKKISSWREELPSLKHILLFDIDGECPQGCLNLDALLAGQNDQFEVAATSAEDMSLLHFTSGTTGKPKGAMHVHGAVVHHIHSSFYALDLKPGDIYWCTADPGWVTGTSYGIIAPLCHRVTLLIDEAEFEPEHWYQVLQDQKVTIWYSAPTAIRMLMKAGNELPRQYDLSSLRFLASVGEPLNPEAVIWSQEVFGQPFHDNWWQTETGGIMIANYACTDVKPGSMGKPLPGIEAGVMIKNDDGELHLSEKNGEAGELAIKVGWPSMFRGYLHEQARYDKCFTGDWYLTGDQAYRDEDGYFWFVGRANDLIKTSGHLIGPFEVESALIEHPAVAEAAVIGIPDDVAGEIVKAYVALNPGFTFDDATQKSIKALARKKLGPSVAPRDIEARANLPKTRSGKIMRRLLRARELGLPEGDISTLESDER